MISEYNDQSYNSSADLFLPNLEPIDIDIVLNVLKGPAEAAHLSREDAQLGLQLTHLEGGSERPHDVRLHEHRLNEGLRTSKKTV